GEGRRVSTSCVVCAARVPFFRAKSRKKPRTLLAHNRRLPGWVARGSSEPEPGSGIDLGFLAFPSGNAFGSRHGDEFQGAHRRRTVTASFSFHSPGRKNPCPFTSSARPRFSSPINHGFSCGRSLRANRNEWVGSLPG